MTTNSTTICGDKSVLYPPHYTAGDVDCIDAIKAATGPAYAAYLQGSIIKYLWRYQHKNGLEDLLKANWFLQKLIIETRSQPPETTDTDSGGT